MKLANGDGQQFEMRILQYQFPHLETEDYDSNWLIIAGVRERGLSCPPAAPKA